MHLLAPGNTWSHTPALPLSCPCSLPRPSFLASTSMLLPSLSPRSGSKNKKNLRNHLVQTPHSPADKSEAQRAGVTCPSLASSKWQKHNPHPGFTATGSTNQLMNLCLCSLIPHYNQKQLIPRHGSSSTAPPCHQSWPEVRVEGVPSGAARFPRRQCHTAPSCLRA